MLPLKSNGTVSHYDTVPLDLLVALKSPIYFWWPNIFTASPVYRVLLESTVFVWIISSENSASG